MKLKTAKGLALQDILTEVHEYVHRGRFTLTQICSSDSVLCNNHSFS